MTIYLMFTLSFWLARMYVVCICCVTGCLSYLSNCHVILHIAVVLKTRSERRGVRAQHKDILCAH